MIVSDVRAIFQAGEVKWRVLENQLPAGNERVAIPDDLIVVQAYAGAPPGHVKGRKAPVQRNPRFQVVCRAKTYPSAYEKAEQVFGLLGGYSGLLNGTGYASIRALGEPFPLPLDGDKARVACNFEATVT